MAEQPQTRVPLTATQPPAAELLNEVTFAAALAELAKSPRVRIETIGRSHEGRPIEMIVVGEPEAFENLSLHQRATLDDGAFAAGGRLPVMFAGDSWGHEASQVEGLINAARTLAFDDTDEVRTALEHTIALIIPLMNPDGREAAIREWTRTPLSAGDTGSGNAYGFLLNRDFVHATQPESRAVTEQVMRWRPAAVLDLHEDMFNLGVRLDEVCFVEPFAAGADYEEHPITRQAIADLGRAIGARWQEKGFKGIYNEAGDNTFAPTSEPGKGLNPMAGSMGRVNLMSTMHAIPSFITESSRTPGSQTWEDRVEQKASAVIAMLQEISSRPERYIAAIRDRLAANLEDAGDGFVAIPLADQPADGLASLLDLLSLHRVEYHRVRTPYDAIVVALKQRETRIARHLLLGEKSKLNEASPALGVRIVQSETLADADRRAFTEAVGEHATLAQAPVAEGPGPFLAKPDVRTTQLVNQLLQTGAARVSRRGGEYLISGSDTAIAWEARRLGVALEAAPGAIIDLTSELKLPRIGLYAGQGIPQGELGEIAWVLDAGSFAYQRLDAADITRPGVLDGLDVLVIPNGVAAEIVAGWNSNAANRRFPWEPAETPAGIGQGGISMIRRFVERGGTYVGLGAGGALLAGSGHLKIADVAYSPAAVGLGQVRLKATQPESPLLFGYSTAEPLPAFFYAPPGANTDGFAFKTEDAVAIYDSVRTNADEQSFMTTAPLEAASGNAAIVHQRCGRGQVVLFGIAPAFRAQWRSTFGLLYNALFLRSL